MTASAHYNTPGSAGNNNNNTKSTPGASTGADAGGPKKSSTAGTGTGSTGTRNQQQQQQRSSSTDRQSEAASFSSQACLYAILGVQRSASDVDIKKAYRRQALRWHPDKNPGTRQERAERMFKRIAQAYEVLSDEKRRLEYDKYGLRGVGLAQSNSTGATGGNNASASAGRSRTRADRERRRTTAFHPGAFPAGFFTSAGVPPGFHSFRSPFDVFREFFADTMFGTGGPGMDPFFGTGGPPPPPSFFADPLEELFARRNRAAHAAFAAAAARNTANNSRPARHSTGSTAATGGVSASSKKNNNTSFPGTAGTTTMAGVKDENKCEFSSVIRFSKSAKDPTNKLKKTTTTARLVDGKRIVTKKIEDDGDETLEVLENGILKSRLINGHPVIVTAV